MQDRAGRWLFDQTRGIHGLTDRERDWLEYSALLHDIGVHISYEGHHKHSAYLIKNGDLRGFEPDEIDTMALVARYHRRATPKRKHDGYGDLTKKRRRTTPKRKNRKLTAAARKTMAASKNGRARSFWNCSL